MSEVKRIIGRYTARWWIEEYHKGLKSGVGAEDSQMERAYRIENLVAVLAIVAVRLLNAKWLARCRAEEPVAGEVFAPEALKLLEARFGRPDGGWTHRAALVAVARLGGFLARKRDGVPGWRVTALIAAKQLAPIRRPLLRLGAARLVGLPARSIFERDASSTFDVLRERLDTPRPG